MLIYVYFVHENLYKTRNKDLKNHHLFLILHWYMKMINIQTLMFDEIQENWYYRPLLIHLIYLKLYEINSTNKNEFIQIDDVLGNPFYIYKNILSYLLKITDSDNLIYLTKTNLAEESSEDNNTPEIEDDEEVCVKLTVNKRCMLLDYTGINVSNDDYENTLTLRETLSGYVVIKMDKDKFEEYDWEENVEFEVTNYEIVNVMYDVNGADYIWEYEEVEEEIESLKNTIEEDEGIYEGYIGKDNYYEKNAYLINEITAEIVNEDDHYNPYGSGF